MDKAPRHASVLGLRLGRRGRRQGDRLVAIARRIENGRLERDRLAPPQGCSQPMGSAREAVVSEPEASHLFWVSAHLVVIPPEGQGGGEASGEATKGPRNQPSQLGDQLSTAELPDRLARSDVRALRLGPREVYSPATTYLLRGRVK